MIQLRRFKVFKRLGLNELVLWSSVLSSLMSGCGKSSINVIKFSQKNTVTPVTEPFTTYLNSCENEEILFYGSSHHEVLRVYPEGVCPADQSVREKIICLKDYSYSISREFFTGKNCVGARSGVLTTFFTTPIEKEKIVNGVEINVLSGPAFLRVESTVLLNRYKDSLFCGDAIWSLNENHEVTGKKCGENPVFFMEKTPLFSIWNRAIGVVPASIQFGEFSMSEDMRPTVLNEVVFKIR